MVLFVSALSTGNLFAQALKTIDISASEKNGLQIKTFNGFQQPDCDLPLLSLRLNGELCSALAAQKTGDSEEKVY